MSRPRDGRAEQTTARAARHNPWLYGLVDLDAIRTFVAVVEQGQFQEAAHELGVTQQAVSKRVAALEAMLGVRLFTRTPKGAQLTVDGQAFLPHAHEVLAAVARAAAAVRPGRRALRVDVIARRIATATMLQDFHRVHPDVDLDVVTLPDERTAVEAVHTGAIDATFRTGWAALPDGVTRRRVLNEPLELLTGPAHDFADAPSITLRDLVGRPIWMPGIVPGTEWAAYYDELSTAFGLSIDAAGPNFGFEHMLDAVSDSRTLCTFISGHTRVAWHTRQDLHRVPLRDPTPVYPHTLIHRSDNAHPGLAALRSHFTAPPRTNPTTTWTPSWA